VSGIAIAVFAVAVLVYAAFSEALDRRHVTAPMVFVVVGAGIGLVLANAPEPGQVRTLAELTLALVLFHDAAELQPRALRHDAGVCARLLFVGLPLTMLAGFFLARWLFPDINGWFALLLAAAVTPTDAGLGAATVLNPVVPVRVRRVLNVESGLNDGLTTPIVLFALSAAGSSGGHEAGSALRELGVGVVFGVVAGALSGFALSRANTRGLMQNALVPVGAVAVPLLCYYGAVAIEGNGFVAAFVSGTAFAAAAGTGLGGERLGGEDRGEAARHPLELTTDGSTLLGYAVWCLFGVILIAHVGDLATAAGVLFAVSALTVLRMVPVALVLLGTGFRRRTRGFIGWFGPRGLASVVFALIAIEEYPRNGEVEHVAGAIALTVLLSVVVHGATADVGAQRYGAWAARTRPPAELGAAITPVSRRGTRRHWRVPVAPPPRAGASDESPHPTEGRP
jgi:NhaP-type Na+/H+ or K+/H+ antiporter